MLNEITIENVAVIEKAKAEFGEGLNVLTGETGAGKSILIDSINAILGNRTTRDIVRNGADKSKIWASFTNVAPFVAQQLTEAGYPCEGELLLYREISVDGKSNCRINGMPATAAMLRDICGNLINIHGQHDNQSLMNPALHIDLLDAYAGNAALLTEYSTGYHALQALQKEKKALLMDEGEKARRIELLRYETEEIELADLRDGEEEQLQEERDVVRHAQNILQSLNAAYYAIAGGEEDTGAAVLLGDAAGEVQQAARYSEDLNPFVETLNDLYYSATEVASDIQDKLSRFEFDGHELDDIEVRLDLIYKLKQKYGTSVQAVIDYGEKAAEELQNIQLSAERLAKLEKEEKLQTEALQQLAVGLTQSRLTAFEELKNQMASALDFLNMPGIVMALQHKEVGFGPKGRDDVELYISTNPGEAPKPLAKVASGGELARIMLALKSAMADKDDVATVIYDEIDTGISGLAAGRIGKMLQDTSNGRQVICVTHTAQVAAHASRHLLIEKQVQNGRTYTHIRELEMSARVEELARIISGDHVTPIAHANASEMLRMAGQPTEV